MVIMPVIHGRRYLRELRATRLAAASNSVGAHAPLGGSTQAASLEMEIGGFPMSAATVQTLSQTDLAALPAGSLPNVVAVDADFLPAARPWLASRSKSRKISTWCSVSLIRSVL